MKEPIITEVRSQGHTIGYGFYFPDGEFIRTEFDEDGEFKTYDTEQEAIDAAKEFKRTRNL